MALSIDGRAVFDNLSHKFTQLLYTRTEGDRNLINKTLDELNALNFRLPIITNFNQAVLLIHNCCTLILPEDTLLVAKTCQLIIKLIDKQHVVVEGKTLLLTLEWCTHALKQGKVVPEVLILIDVLLRSSRKNIENLSSMLLQSNSVIFRLAKSDDSNLVHLSLKCLESCTILDEETKSSISTSEVPSHIKLCSQMFMYYLTAPKEASFDNIFYYKIIISCLIGLENIIQRDQQFLIEHLEYILGIVKCFMVYQLNGVNFPVPEKVRASTMSIPDLSTNMPRDVKGGKVVRHRKTRPAKQNKKSKAANDKRSDNLTSEYTPASTIFDSNSDSEPQFAGYLSQPQTSDSDFSDTERSTQVKTAIIASRIRQASLQLFLNIIQSLDKKVAFSYWSNFIPDVFPYSYNSLATCILREPSTKGRLVALNVLLALIRSAKLYLSLAEYSSKTTSFTPFTMVIGSMVRELHRILILALNENCLPVLLQVLKCLAALVQASPYYKLGPGIVHKVVRNMKALVFHRDYSIQIGALIVLGCILASEPVVSETKEIFLRAMPQKEHKPNANESKNLDNSKIDEDIEYARFSSDEEDGTDTTPNDSLEVSWLLARCLNNLGVACNNKPSCTVSATVKLESLQVISVMTRNYFECFLASHLALITSALEITLSDKHVEVKLRAGQTLDFIGQAINRHFINNGTNSHELPLQSGLLLWQTLLNGPLMNILQNEELPVLKTVACDCIASIGSHVFDRLSRERQLLIVSVLFSYTRENDDYVKAAAVRALAICVVHPSLREDFGFVIDTAEAILSNINDKCLTLRAKSSWSLANLCDALVLIKEHSMSRDDSFLLEEIPDSLILRLIEEGVKGCKDNDNVRTNSVRSLGNLFQLITEKHLQNEKFRKAVVNGIDVLVGNCSVAAKTNVKVRWNACYAINNMLKNEVLFKKLNTWQDSVFNTLMDLVVNFRNFKVRINATLALSALASRELYGNYYVKIWNALTRGLENSYHLQDFSEHMHRDNLVDQICLTLGHLLTLLTLEDLAAMKDSISLTIPTLHAQIPGVLERLVPEKATILVNASTHVSNLRKTVCSEDREILNELHEAFSARTH